MSFAGLEVALNASRHLNSGVRRLGDETPFVKEESFALRPVNRIALLSTSVKIRSMLIIEIVEMNHLLVNRCAGGRGVPLRVVCNDA
jgi:hypothetical protein